MSSGTYQGVNLDTPLVYLGNMEKPGIYLMWDLVTNAKPASFDIYRSQYIDSDYTKIDSLTFPTREYIDLEGKPGNYYKIYHLDQSDAVIATSGPFKGEGLLLFDSVAYEIKEWLHKRIYDEPARFRSGIRNIAYFTFPTWNSYPEPEIRISSSSDGTVEPYLTLTTHDTILNTSNDPDEDNYPEGLKIAPDYEGRVFFQDSDGARVNIQPSDYILASYTIRLFTADQINSAIMLAFKSLSMLPGVPKISSIDSIPFFWEPAIVSGATYFLIRRLLLQLTDRERKLLFSDPDGQDNRVSEDLRQTAEMYKSEWEMAQKSLPLAVMPQMMSSVIPPFAMPGQRSRYFKSMWLGGA